MSKGTPARNVRVPTDLWETAKKVASFNGDTVSDMIRDDLELRVDLAEITDLAPSRRQWFKVLWQDADGISTISQHLLMRDMGDVLRHAAKFAFLNNAVILSIQLDPDYTLEEVDDLAPLASRK